MKCQTIKELGQIEVVNLKSSFYNTINRSEDLWKTFYSLKKAKKRGVPW
jgi:hypothetical protein